MSALGFFVSLSLPALLRRAEARAGSREEAWAERRLLLARAADPGIPLSEALPHSALVVLPYAAGLALLWSGAAWAALGGGTDSPLALAGIIAAGTALCAGPLVRLRFRGGRVHDARGMSVLRGMSDGSGKGLGDWEAMDVQSLGFRAMSVLPEHQSRALARLLAAAGRGQEADGLARVMEGWLGRERAVGLLADMARVASSEGERLSLSPRALEDLGVVLERSGALPSPEPSAVGPS